MRNQWINYLDPDLNKGSWSNDEDNKIIELIDTIGKKWGDISRNLPGRTWDYIRNRYRTLIRKYSNDQKIENEEMDFSEKNILEIDIETQTLMT